MEAKVDEDKQDILNSEEAVSSLPNEQIEQQPIDEPGCKIDICNTGNTACKSDIIKLNNAIICQNCSKFINDDCTCITNEQCQWCMMSKQFKNFEEKLDKTESQVDQLKAHNKNLSDLCNKLKDQCTTIQKENLDLKEQMSRGHFRVTSRINKVECQSRQVEELSRRTIKEVGQQLRRIRENPSHSPGITNLDGGVIWNVDKIDDIIKNKQDVWGPFFYVKNYKFRVNVTTKVENGYLSIYIALSKGMYDDELIWPFSGEFIIILNNKTNRGEDYRKEWVTTTEHRNTNFRKPTSEKNIPIGFPKFINCEMLKEIKFSKGNSITLTVLINTDII